MITLNTKSKCNSTISSHDNKCISDSNHNNRNASNILIIITTLIRLMIISLL